MQEYHTARELNFGASNHAHCVPTEKRIAVSILGFVSQQSERVVQDQQQDWLAEGGPEACPGGNKVKPRAGTRTIHRFTHLENLPKLSETDEPR